MSKEAKVINTKAKKDIEFSKEAIIYSNKYRQYRDALNVLLKNGKKYTFEEVNKLLDQFYKTEVK